MTRRHVVLAEKVSIVGIDLLVGFVAGSQWEMADGPAGFWPVLLGFAGVMLLFHCDDLVVAWERLEEDG